MEQHLYVIGIDGGGTKTTAIICALDGTILAETQGGPVNFQIIGVERSANTIIDLILTCSHSIGCSVPQIGAVVAGLTGAGRQADQEIMKEGILSSARSRNFDLNSLIVESDARIALEGAFKGKPGIILIGGTGSIVFGKDENEKTYRVGGWGRIIRDEGSGYAIGQEAFRAVARSLDGYKGKTKLVKLFGDKYGFRTQEDIINAVYKGNFDIASVVPAVIEAASKGDRVARNILTQQASEITDIVRTMLGKMKNNRRRSNKIQLALAGSLLSGKNIYSQMVKAEIKRILPPLSICEPDSSPVVGAALMAAMNLKLNKTK